MIEAVQAFEFLNDVGGKGLSEVVAVEGAQNEELVRVATRKSRT